MNDKDLLLRLQEIIGRYGREDSTLLAEELRQSFELEYSEYFSDQIEEKLGHELDIGDQEKVNHLYRHLYHRRCS